MRVTGDGQQGGVDLIVMTGFIEERGICEAGDPDRGRKAASGRRELCVIMRGHKTAKEHFVFGARGGRGKRFEARGQRRCQVKRAGYGCMQRHAGM